MVLFWLRVRVLLTLTILGVLIQKFKLLSLTILTLTRFTLSPAQVLRGTAQNV